jgi:hypothetical protein
MKRLYFTFAIIAGMGLVACGNATDEATAEATAEVAEAQADEQQPAEEASDAVEAESESAE